MKVFNFITQKETTLKDALHYYCSGLTNLDIMRALKNKDVKINGKRVRQDTMLQIGDEVQIYYSPNQYYDIIYNDNNILVINKLKSIETNSADEQKQTLLKELQVDFPSIKPIHRLDTNTLGLIVFALNSLAETELLRAFKNGYVVKKYLAIVSANNVKNKDYFFDSFQKHNGYVHFGKAKHDGNDARLEYECIERNEDLATILVTLHTGKTHQIRAQLSYHQIYILGDGKYGDKMLNRKYKKSQQQLKSVYLHFTNLNKLKYLEEKPFSLLSKTHF